MTQKQVSSLITIPPEIQQMAKEAQLGEPHKVYSASYKDSKVGGIAFFAIGAFFVGMSLLLFFLLRSPYTNDWMPLIGLSPLLIFGGLLSLLGAIALYQGFFSYCHVYLWQNGFIYEKSKVRQVFHWEQIDSVQGSVREVEYHSQKPRIAIKRIIYDYKVHHQNGTEIELSNIFPEIDELAGILLEESVRQFAPQTVHVIDPEQVVAFSNFTLDRQGISKMGKQSSKREETSNEQEKVAWEEIWEVAIKAGTPIVRKTETET